MAIYTNEHLTDLLNEQYEKNRELEKEIKILRLSLQSHGEIVEMNDSFKRTIKHLTDVYASPNEILRRRYEYLDETLNEVRE